MQSSYSEDALIEQPAIELFKELGWEAANCYNESFDSTLSLPSPKGRGNISLGRETTAEVVLVSRLRPALERLNPDAAKEVIDDAIEQLTRDRRAMTPAQANREIYKLLKDGVRVIVQSATLSPTLSQGRGSQSFAPSSVAPSPRPSPKGRGGQEVERIRVIDWENPENNDFFLASRYVQAAR